MALNKMVTEMLILTWRVADIIYRLRVLKNAPCDISDFLDRSEIDQGAMLF